MKTFAKAAFATTVLAGLGLAAAAPALADDDRCGHVPRGEWMSVAAITDRATSQGYEVLGVSSDDGCWEVEAFDKDRRKLDVYFHPVSAEIMHRDYDD